MSYKKSFKSDLFSPLDKVERVWLRRTAVIMLIPAVFIIGTLGGGLFLIEQWIEDCW